MYSNTVMIPSDRIAAWCDAGRKAARRRKITDAMIILQAALTFIVCMLVLIGAERYRLS